MREAKYLRGEAGTLPELPVTPGLDLALPFPIHVASGNVLPALNLSKSMNGTIISPCRRTVQT